MRTCPSRGSEIVVSGGAANDNALSSDPAARYRAATHAERTLYDYASAFRAFQGWANARGVLACPAETAAVATYLAELADVGRSVSTIARHLAAIAWAHREAGAAFDADNPELRRVLQGIRRTIGRPPEKKAPLGPADLLAVVSTLGSDLAGLRDRALLTLGWAGAFRRSELAALRVEDLRFEPEGMIVLVRGGKTDQEGRGLEKAIPHAADPRLCPVRAVRACLSASGLDSGALFRRITVHGHMGLKHVNPCTVADIVKRAAEAAGYDPDRLAGHSLRSGFITAAARSGKSLDAIMRQSGHRSVRVARGYIQHATLFIDNAATGLL